MTKQGDKKKGTGVVVNPLLGEPLMAVELQLHSPLICRLLIFFTLESTIRIWIMRHLRLDDAVTCFLSTLVGLFCHQLVPLFALLLGYPTLQKRSDPFSTCPLEELAKSKYG